MKAPVATSLAQGADPERTPAASPLGTTLLLLLTLASAVFVAWSAHRNLGPALGLAPAGPSTWVVGVTKPPVWIEGVLVDGVSQRWKHVVKEGTWKENPTFTTTQLGFVEPEGSGSLTFTGERLTIVFQAAPAGGEVQIEQDGSALGRIDLSAGEVPSREVVFEAPEQSTPAWSFPTFLVLALVAAFVLAPWAPARSGEGWLIFYLVALHGILAVAQYVCTWVDSTVYFGSRKSVWWGTPAYFPPGYPGLLLLLDLVPFGTVGTKVTLVQHAMMILTILWLHRLLRGALGKGAAFVGALASASCWSALFLPRIVMSEVAGLFGMIGAIWFAVRAREDDRTWPAVLSGILAGFAGLARVVPLAVTVPAVLVIFLLPPSRGGVRRALVALAVTAMLMAAPAAWQLARSGDPRLADSTGEHMWNRVVWNQRKLAEDGPATQRLLSLLDGEDPRGKPYWVFREPLARKGLSRREYVDLFRQVAMEGLWDDPAEFVKVSFSEAWRWSFANAATRCPKWATDGWNATPALEPPPPIPVSRSALEWRMTLDEAHGVIWKPAVWLFLAATVLIAFLKRRTILYVLAWIPCIYMVATASLDNPYERYNAAIVPVVIALAAAVVHGAMTGLADRALREPQSQARKPG